MPIPNKKVMKKKREIFLGLKEEVITKRLKETPEQNDLLATCPYKLPVCKDFVHSWWSKHCSSASNSKSCTFHQFLVDAWSPKYVFKQDENNPSFAPSTEITRWMAQHQNANWLKHTSPDQGRDLCIQIESSWLSFPLQKL